MILKRKIYNALVNRDAAYVEEWTAEWYPEGLLHDYVWNKIKVEVDDDEDDEY